MNPGAAVHALKRIKKDVQARTETIKVSIKESQYSLLSVRPEDFIKAKHLPTSKAGTYRVDFGGVYANVFYDGAETFFIYKPPSNKDGGNEKMEDRLLDGGEPLEPEDDEHVLFKMRDKASICKSLGLKEKDTSVDDIIKSIEALCPGITGECEIVAKKTSSIRAKNGKSQTLTDIEIFEHIDDQYYKKIIKETVSALAYSFKDDLDALEYFKKLEGKIKTLEDFLVEILKKDYSENPYVSMSAINSIEFNQEKLTNFCLGSDASVFSIFATEDIEQEKKASIVIGYCGKISEIDDDYISEELLEALTTIHNQSKTAKANKDNDTFQTFDEKNSENCKLGRLSR